MFLTKVVLDIKTHIPRSILFPRQSRRLLYNMEQYGRARLVTDDMRFECLIVQDKTLAICNTYRFSTAPVVMLTRLSITLLVHCLFFFHCFHVDVFVIRFVAFLPTVDNFVCIHTKPRSSFVSVDRHINCVRAIRSVQLTVLPSNRYHLFQVMPSCVRQ